MSSCKFFEARAKDLESELAKARLFASSENELLPAAVELFRNLRQLENMPDSEISSAYSSLAVKLGANVIKTLKSALILNVLIIHPLVHIVQLVEQRSIPIHNRMLIIIVP